MTIGGCEGEAGIVPNVCLISVITSFGLISPTIAIVGIAGAVVGFEEGFGVGRSERYRMSDSQPIVGMP